MSSARVSRYLVGLGAVSALAAIVSLSTASCGSSTTENPLRTFERAQRMDVVCLHVQNADAYGNLYEIPAEPLPQDNCAPVPEDVDGSTLLNHLYALVTQTARGEVAVVDLTQGAVIDVDHKTPGTNFLPVGALPTDVGVTPDGKYVFVPAAETYKPALYMIPSKSILGDVQQISGVGVVAPNLTDWPVCGLTQAPGQMNIVQREDGSYEIALTMPGDETTPARLVTIDPTPLTDGTIAPGSLTACPITSSIVIGSTVPTAAVSPTWDDGIDWIDGGAPAEAVPSTPACTTTTSDGGTTTPVITDGGMPLGTDAGLASDAGTATGTDAGTTTTGSITGPHLTAMARVGTTLYIGDDALPLIHVVDVSTPGKPKELAPLVVSSILDPSRTVGIKDLSISPPTSKYQRFLYAVDAKDGSVIVFDVTDPVNSPHVPLTRPHPELNPFQAPDRLTFSAPVAAVSFVQHDRFLQKLADSTQRVAYKSGLICNPNPNAGPSSNLANTNNDVQLGAFYRADVSVTSTTGTEISLGPTRLRGIFGFVTLTTGSVVAVDVDDWDGPCRRPDPMDADGGAISSVCPQEPAATSSSDLDPYHTPIAFDTNSTTGSSPVTLEDFFPVSAPHRARSAFYLRNDPTSGTHIPFVNGVPELFQQNAPLPTGGPGASVYPLILPTSTTLADPTYVSNPTEPNPKNRIALANPTDDPNVDGGTGASPGVRLSWEDPQVQTDQDWLVTYEGQLPGFTNVTLTLSPRATGDYSTLVAAPPGANFTDAGVRSSPLFCKLGVEDVRQGQARAQAVASELSTLGLAAPSSLMSRTGDYIQITDDIVDPDDVYWSEDNECWDPSQTPDTRYNSCNTLYGVASDQSVQRDFPILEAYDDHLVIGRFNYPSGQTPAIANRGITQADPSNVAFLKAARCCFHNQVHVNVRAGGEWINTGSIAGYMNKVTADPVTNACVQSCDPRLALLSSRSFEIPRPTGSTPAIDRNNVIALRNPMFSYIMWAGSSATTRDDFWKFSTRGEFTALNVNIATSSSSVSPQSMHFIDSLGLLAVVDGSNEGLVLIDLNTITLAHDPFF